MSRHTVKPGLETLSVHLSHMIPESRLVDRYQTGPIADIVRGGTPDLRMSADKHIVAVLEPGHPLRPFPQRMIRTLRRCSLKHHRIFRVFGQDGGMRKKVNTDFNNIRLAFCGNVVPVRIDDPVRIGFAPPGKTTFMSGQPEQGIIFLRIPFQLNGVIFPRSVFGSQSINGKLARRTPLQTQGIDFERGGRFQLQIELVHAVEPEFAFDEGSSTVECAFRRKFDIIAVIFPGLRFAPDNRRAVQQQLVQCLYGYGFLACRRARALLV